MLGPVTRHVHLHVAVTMGDGGVRPLRSRPLLPFTLHLRHSCLIGIDDLVITNRHLLVSHLMAFEGCGLHCVLEGGLYDLYVAHVVISHILGRHFSQFLYLLA